MCVREADNIGVATTHGYMTDRQGHRWKTKRYLERERGVGGDREHGTVGDTGKVLQHHKGDCQQEQSHKERRLYADI